MTIQVSLVSIHLYLYILIFYETHFSLVLNIILYPFFTSTFESEQSEYKFVRKGQPSYRSPKDTIYHAPRDRGNIDFSEQLEIRDPFVKKG
jgi:hypothetical protein